MAFIRNTDKLIEGSSKLFFSNVRAKAAVQSDLDSLSAGISSEQSARQSEDSGIKLRLDVIEGGAGVSGSIAKAQADAQAYADQKVAALINSAPEVLDTLKELSDAIGGDASFAATVAGQIGAVDAKVDQEILDRQTAISALESSMGVDISAEESRAMAAEAALDLRLDALELDPVSKTYVDGIQSSLDSRLDILEQDETTKAYVDSQVSAEQSRAEAAEGLLDGRLDVLEQDPTTKAYVDGEVSSLQSQITQEISDRQSAVSAEESRAMAAEGALDVRLDVLEQDPTTKAYVDGIQSALDARLDIIEGVDSVEGSVAKAEKDAKDYADSLNSAMDLRVDVLEQDPTTKSYVDGIQSALDSRLDLLEADPVSKTYVDGEVSYLQGQITQEISNRQSAVSAEEVRAMAAEVLLDGRLDILEQDPTTKTYVDSEVASEESRAMSAESALSGRLDVLELDPVSKTYVDGEVSDLQGQVTTEKGRIDAILLAADADKDSFAEIVSLINSVDTTNDSAFAGYVLSNDAALAQEVSDRQAGDSALDARLDVIEGLDSVEGSVAKAEKDAKDYADAAVLVEKNRAEAAEGLLDGRLDVLESDPTTKAYVDGEISSVESRLDVIEGIGEGSVAKAEQDAKDYADSLNSAMDARVDVLEADPTTKSYVDSEVAALEAEDLTMFKKDGSRAMTGQLQAVDGTTTAPSFSFASKANTGVFLLTNASTALGLGLTFNGSTKLSCASSGVGISGLLNMASSSGANITWGIDGAGNIGASGANRPNNIYVKTDVVAGGKLFAGQANQTAPSYAFNGSTNSGMFYDTNFVGIAVAGNKILDCYTGSVTAQRPVVMNQGYGIVRTATAGNLTVTTSHGLVAVTDTSAARTITLPSAVTATGRHFIIKDESGAASETNYIRIQPAVAGQTLDGDSYYDIVVPYESVNVYSNGTNWFIV